jgi:hypothetical protein
MRLLTLTAMLTSTVLFAQEKPADQSQLLPQRQTALDKAVKNLLARSASQGDRKKTSGPVVNLMREDTRCGYLRVLPADPTIDPRMVVPPATGGTMPIYSGIPPCEASAPSGAAKP